MTRAEPVSKSALDLGAFARALEAALGAGSVRVIGDASVAVRGLSQDSRRVEPGTVFAARSGGRADGHAFIPRAIERGASAVLFERGRPLPDVATPMVEVSDVRRAIAHGAEIAFGLPSHRLGVAGITGTNGKTTVAWLLERTLEAVGVRCARLGTLGYSFEGDVVDSPLTTPEADVVAYYSARARDAGASHLAMEVSSHALSLDRAEAIRFAVAVFTNLTQDHLDYHHTMDEYGRAKLRLFTDLNPGASVINVDDAFGARIAGVARGRVIRVGRAAAADVRVERAEPSERGIRARLRTPSGVIELASPLVGEHNLENLVVVLGIVEAFGLDLARAAAALEGISAAPGRLERCDGEGDDVLVLVDYAHTPDALTRALAAVRALAPKELWCVFGCGGDRDPGKRPRMGAAAGAGADRAVVTNDNPRSEDPRAIAAAIEDGLRLHSTPWIVELDRAMAIERAILDAPPGAAVLLAGKGHEPYQIIGAVRRDFDDRVEARRALALRRSRTGVR